MEDAVRSPGRLRRRLIVAFVLVAAVLTAGLAVGTYGVVRTSLLDDSLTRAQREARFGLSLAADLPSRSELQPFVDAFQRRGVRAILVLRGRRVVSDPTVSPPIPDELRAIVVAGHLGYARVSVSGTPYLIVGGRPPGTRMQLYLLVSERELAHDLSVLRTVLAVGWVVAVLVAAAVGWLVARRTLAPVGRASRAARALAEGLLETRLPVEGRDEFGAWAASFNEMADALASKIAALQAASERERRFTGDVAHELRTPLTALVSEAAILQEQLDELPEDARRAASMLVADVARLRRLVDDLIEVARLDAEAEPVLAERVDLAALVGAVARARGDARAVAVRAAPVQIVSDARRLERIVGNLIDNGLRHGGGRVEVRVDRSDGEAVIEVADHGPGIPAEEARHVFERFFKVDRSRAGQGSGLGLAIAQENARALGGRIEMDNRPGRGVTFAVRVPVSEPLHGGDPAVSLDRHADGETSPKGGGSP